MRLLLLLLLPSMAWAIPMSECPGGGYVPTANYPTWCPNDVTTISTAPTDTGATISVTSTAATGTTYVSIRTTATEVHWRTIVNGTGDEASASASQSSTTTAIAVTGLTDSTEYVAHVVNVVNNKPSSYETATFTTSAGGGSGTAIAGGDDWFFCPDGSDAASGLSHANRKANYPQTDTSMLGASDDMWLCTGGIWTQRPMDIDRTCASGDWCETGTYYMDGATAREAVDGVMGMGTTHTKATLRGALTTTCINAGTCTFPTTGYPMDGGLEGIYDAHIEVSATSDYHRFINLRIELTRTNAITFTGTTSGSSLNYLIVDGIDTQYTGDQGPIILQDGVQDVVARNNSIDLAGMCETIKARGTSSNTATCNGDGWANAGIFVTRSSGARVLMEYNEITRGFGEALGSFNSSGARGIIRNNRIANMLSANIYLDGSPNWVVESNIMVGNTVLNPWYTSVWPAFSCITVGGEVSTYPSSTGEVVRNNLCLGIHAHYEATNASPLNIGVKFYNNVGIFANDREIYSEQPTARTTELDIQGNVSWTQGTIWRNCYIVASNAVVNKNHWYVSAASLDATDPDCTDNDSGHDSYGAAPGFALSTYAEWQALSVPGTSEITTWPTWANATPQGGSPVKSTGPYLSSAILDIANYGYAFDQIREVLAGTLTEAEWECANCVDAAGTTRANPPSKGAIE